MPATLRDTNKRTGRVTAALLQGNSTNAYIFIRYYCPKLIIELIIRYVSLSLSITVTHYYPKSNIFAQTRSQVSFYVCHFFL
jgi:hypothetical protein